MPYHSALRCVSGIRQNNAKPLISNGLRFIVTCLLTAALWVLFHCFRHTYAVLQLANGTDIYTVSKMLTHKHVTTAEIYLELLEDTKTQTLGRIQIHKNNDPVIAQII